MDCKHLHRVGDNYGESCADCGKQLSGYGWGGWFGRNLTNPLPVCIHLFAPLFGEGGPMVCIYCEQPKAEAQS
jgi:hypothetical protein